MTVGRGDLHSMVGDMDCYILCPNEAKGHIYTPTEYPIFLTTITCQTTWMYVINATTHLAAILLTYSWELREITSRIWWRKVASFAEQKFTLTNSLLKKFNRYGLFDFGITLATFNWLRDLEYPTNRFAASV